MSAVILESRLWPARRSWTAVAAVFTLQLVLMLWLGDRVPVRPRPTRPSPSLRFAGVQPGGGGAAAELLELVDPTLFALPHQRGFSGQAWLTIPAREFRPFVWSEPPRWLSLPPADLGASFQQLVSGARAEPLPLLGPPPAGLTWPAVASAPLGPLRSGLRLAGDLARRQPVVLPELDSWPAADILTNTVVRLLVEPGGRPFSAVLLAGCGSLEADSLAVRQALALRFKPVAEEDLADTPRPGDLSWGEVIFEWRTISRPGANPPVNPP